MYPMLHYSFASEKFYPPKHELYMRHLDTNLDLFEDLQYPYKVSNLFNSPYNI
jgi:hypothetical protein